MDSWLKNMIRAAFLAVGLVATCAVQAQEDNGPSSITLINGMTINGSIQGVTPDGLEITVGRSTRTYPWYALSPGTRFKYDQSYRMNIDGYLAGADAASLTNAPDPEYDPLNPSPETSADAVEAVSATRSFQYSSLGNAPSMIPSEVPALTVISLAPYEFHAVQYGAAPDEIVLFGFSADDPSGLLILNMKEGRIETENAASRKINDTAYHAFTRQAYASDVGGVAAEQNIQWLVDKNDPSRRYMNAEVNLSRGSQRATFILQGDPSYVKPADESLTPRPLLVEPAMSFTITIEDEKPFLVGRVRMGRLSLFPRSGMDLKVDLDILDGNGRSVLKQSLPFSADGDPDDHPLRIDLSLLASGQQYKLTASMSLGALLGDATHEMFFIMPDAAKL